MINNAGITENRRRQQQKLLKRAEQQAGSFTSGCLYLESPPPYPHNGQIPQYCLKNF